MAIRDSLPKYLKVLSSLGAAALLAKYFISSEIDKKISQSNVSGLGNNVKIVLIKKASDYSVASSLSKQSLHNALPKGYNSEDSSEKSVDVSLANKVLKRLLKRTKTSAGNKLNTMLRAAGLGHRVVENTIQKGN